MTTSKDGYSGAPRDVALEALRGMASVAVVFWHFLLAFAPALLGDPGSFLAGTPWFAFVHGTGAVCVFFVLSGYVLTRRYFETGQSRLLIIGALKRWFRLALPIFVSVMASWLLFRFGLYAYQDAARFSHSDWLYSFGFSMLPPFDPNFMAAIHNGLMEPFYHDNNAFNPLLWTMHIELPGSYIAFAFAPVVLSLREKPFLVALIAVVVGVSLSFVESFLVPFLPGVLLACYAHRLKPIKPLMALCFIVIGLVFLGYREPIGFYSFLSCLRPINGEPLRAYTGTVGAVFLMASFIGCEPLRRRLQGPFARYLGRVSFPLYLVHLIILFSLGSAVFALVSDGNSPATALFLTALVVLPVIILAAALMAVIDQKWIAFVNSAVRKVKLAG